MAPTCPPKREPRRWKKVRIMMITKKALPRRTLLRGLGTTLALPVDVHTSVKFFASSGVSARTGNNFDLFGVAWQYRWGGGL